MSKKADKRRFSVTLTTAYVDALDKLVEDGLYLDHQDGIRGSLRRLFRHHGIEPFISEIAEKAQE